jgi:hypothetical protein
VQLIEAANPDWHDLYIDMMTVPASATGESMGPG